MSDSLSYSPHAASVNFRPKIKTLPSVPALLSGQGPTLISQTLSECLDDALSVATSATFDELADEFPKLLREVREQVEQAVPWEVTPGQRILAGYSGRKKRFVACRYVSTRGYRREYVDRFFLTPTPFSWRPDRFESDDLTSQVSEDAAGLQQFMRQWTKAPRPNAPDTPEEWWKLAQTVWEARACNPFGRTLLAGPVHLHTLTADGHESIELGALGTAESDARRMYQGTLHPLGQWEPCGPLCDGDGSMPYVECCAKVALDQPCECHSGLRFRECHLIERPRGAAVRAE